MISSLGLIPLVLAIGPQALPMAVFVGVTGLAFGAGV